MLCGSGVKIHPLIPVVALVAIEPTVSAVSEPAVDTYIPAFAASSEWPRATPVITRASGDNIPMAQANRIC